MVGVSVERIALLFVKHFQHTNKHLQAHILFTPENLMLYCMPMGDVCKQETFLDCLTNSSGCSIPAVVSFISLRQFNPAMDTAFNMALLCLSV